MSMSGIHPDDPDRLIQECLLKLRGVMANHRRSLLLCDRQHNPLRMSADLPRNIAQHLVII